MSAPARLYQEIEAEIARCAGPALRVTSARRLAALVAGMLGSERCVSRRVAQELGAMGLRAARGASTERRVRRTLADARLDDGAGDGARLAAAVDWPVAEPVVLVLDESTTAGGTHVLRLSVAYRGSCVPLAWAVWPHQVTLPRGAYWHHVDAVLDRAQTLLPPHLPVVVLADRADDVPAVLDRLTARGWGWIVRLTARAKLVWRDAAGAEQPLRDRLTAALARPGDRVREAGALFKQAGWRAVQVVGEWGHGDTEPLVVATNREPRWRVLARSARRCWIEAAFRQDKGKGWDWEASQVRDPAHQWRLVLALAWASRLVLGLGAAQAASAVAALLARPRRPKPSHPRDSLFGLGLGRLRAWLYGTIRDPLPWHLPRLTAPSWCAEWLAWHDALPAAETVRP